MSPDLDRRRRAVLAALAASLLIIGGPAVARADAGIPMLIVMWPLSWLAFPIVLIVEANVARKILGLSTARSLATSAAANAASTLLGIPITWGALAALEILVAEHAYGLTTPARKIFAVTVQAPWLIPYEGDVGWMIPAAAIVLLGPFYLTSVFLERWVVRRLTEATKEAAAAWSWRANTLSYGCLLVVLLPLAILGARAK